MNPYDRHQLTVRELSAHYADRCPPALTLILSACMALSGVCVAAIVIFSL